MKKAIFLDIDGVLNSERSMMETFKRDGQSFLASRHVSPELVGRFNSLIERTHADVVISSSWRLVYSVNEICSILEQAGFKHSHKVVGVTPSFACCKRGHEIAAWMGFHELLHDDVAIFDDCEDMVDLTHRLVLTDPAEGLSNIDVRHAIKMLSGRKR